MRYCRFVLHYTITDPVTMFAGMTSPSALGSSFCEDDATGRVANAVTVTLDIEVERL